MALLNREQFLAAKTKKFEDVELPELGGSVRIKSMSIKQQLEFENLMTTQKNDNDIIFSLIVLSCVDQDLKPLFTHEDVEEIKDHSADSVMTLFQAILDLNGINTTDMDQRAKNS